MNMSKKHKKHHRAEKNGSADQPIKLVLNLKVPSGTENEALPSYPPPDSEERHKKHKKKKKKHKHHHDERKEERKEKVSKREHSETEVDITDSSEEPSVKKALLDDAVLKRLREPRSCTVGRSGESGTLKACLDYIQRTLQRKDSNGFFAYPVNDIIAPGYSSIISQPMDFSTMQNKIDKDVYDNVMEYKQDYKLMCENAMTYNHPDTIFYKAAQKLLDSGMKLMSRDGLTKLKNTLSAISNITDGELGLDQQVEEADYIRPKPKEKRKSKVVKKPVEKVEVEDDGDDDGAKEILALAEAAAKEAEEELARKKALSKIGFLRRKEDGTTSLNFINPDNDGVVSETERIITIGQMVGKLQSGTGSIAGFKEDKRNRVTPITYLQSGPFSSYAPYYDSAFANLSKEDSDVLLSTYGSDQAVSYADSLQSFVADASDYAIKMVDNMLDILTGGEHSKTQVILEERKAERELLQKEEQEKLKKQNETDVREAVKDENIDFESVRSLSELGIDTSFIDDIEVDFKKAEQTKCIQQKLDNMAELINTLETTQSQRLSQKPTQHLAHIPGPTENENQLAQKVTSELKDLTKQVSPSDVSSLAAVRSAMGVATQDQTVDAAAEINKQLQEIIKGHQESSEETMDS